MSVSPFKEFCRSFQDLVKCGKKELEKLVPRGGNSSKHPFLDCLELKSSLNFGIKVPTRGLVSPKTIL